MSIYVNKLRSKISIGIIANFSQAILGLITIPLATYILNADDYGVYAYVIAITSLFVAFAETGTSYLIYGNYMNSHESDRRRMAATVVCVSVVIGMIASLTLLLLWIFNLYFTSQLLTLDFVEALLICASIPLKSMWVTFSVLLIARSMSFWIPVTLFIQALVNVIVLLTGLYIFNFGRSALFIGNFSGALVVVMLGIIILNKSLLGKPSKLWFKKLMGFSLGGWFSGVLESFRNTIEATFIIKAGGVSQLGIYNHSKIYYGIPSQVVNIFSASIWPIALKEAINQESKFAPIKNIWDLIYILLTVYGLFFVFFGVQIVDFLTHGKFNSAAGLIPLLIIYLLIQNSDRTATAAIYAFNGGNYYSAIKIFSLTFSIALIYFLVPEFGVYGVYAAVFILIFERLVIRIFMEIVSRRFRKIIPFIDQLAIFGCLNIVLALFLNNFLTIDSWQRVVIFGLLVTLQLYLGRMCLKIIFLKNLSEV